MKQVKLTGARLAPASEEELSARLQARFKLTPEKSAAMLKGRCVIMRGLDPVSADKLVKRLREIGLEAISEDAKPPRTAPAAASPAAIAQPGRRAPLVSVEVSTDLPSHTATNTSIEVSAEFDGSSTLTPSAPTPQSQALAAEQSARQHPAPSAEAGSISAQRRATASGSAVASGQAHRSAASSSPLDALNALANQDLPKPRTSAGYVAGLLLVTLLCAALPAIYAGFTAAVGYGWFWYLTHIHHYLPRQWQLILLMYAVPGLTGAVLILFLLRPLFASRPKPPQAVVLDPQKEPAFVAGVHSLCRAIGVSPPSEIQLNWEANASVHFRTRWLSLFSGHKVLTIGMSLVGGMSSRQLVGVLAHEFGHFAQRFGMICSFTVNSVNAWLEHSAYGEDALDRKLREWSDAATEQEHWFSGVVNISIAATWFAIALTRRLMAGLFLLSLRLSRYMSRQMEFDADRYEAIVAGSDTFRTTARTLRALNHAFGEVNRANIEAWQERRLLADIPEAVAIHAGTFDAARLEKIDSEMREETTTRFWDSHPPDVARIDNAEKLQAPGLYHHTAPATALFKDFTMWSKQATRLFYSAHEVDYKPEQLRTRDEILGSSQHRAQKREQIDRFFNRQFQDWPLMTFQVPENATLGWQECIDQIRSRSPEIARNWQQASQTHETRAQMRAAVTVQASSREVGLGGPERSADALGVELGKIAGHQMPFDKPLGDAFALYAQRFQHAIETMDGADRERAVQLRDTLTSLGALERDITSLSELVGALRLFESFAQQRGGELPPRFKDLEVSFGDCASKVLERASRIPQTVMDGGTVGGYLRICCSRLPAPGTSAESIAIAEASAPMPAALHRLYLLALGELVALCEEAEKARGIRPIRLVA